MSQGLQALSIWGTKFCQGGSILAATFGPGGPILAGDQILRDSSQTRLEIWMLQSYIQQSAAARNQVYPLLTGVHEQEVGL